MTIVYYIIDRKEDYDNKIRLLNVVYALDTYIKGCFENCKHLSKCSYAQPLFAFNRTASMIDGNCKVHIVPLHVIEYLISEINHVHCSLMEDCREKLVLHIGH